eukprot:16441673-Heterocapsa_arctica.AAC.3
MPETGALRLFHQLGWAAASCEANHPAPRIAVRGLRPLQSSGAARFIGRHLLSPGPPWRREGDNPQPIGHVLIATFFRSHMADEAAVAVPVAAGPFHPPCASRVRTAAREPTGARRRQQRKRKAAQCSAGQGHSG